MRTAREQTVLVEKIRVDGGTQLRETIDEQTVADYSEVVKSGGKFPRITVFQDGIQLWLGDGFHRYFAHKRAGVEHIDALVYTGTIRDAILFAAGCNSGLRRSPADLEKAVTTLLKDKEWGVRSDRWIAEQCKVHHQTVASHRAKLVVVNNLQLDDCPVGKKRAGKDGRQRSLPTKKAAPPTIVLPKPSPPEWLNEVHVALSTIVRDLDNNVMLFFKRLAKVDGKAASKIDKARGDLRRALTAVANKL